jgi:hypothetical protein
MNICISTIHVRPVEATVLGNFKNPYSDMPPHAVRYCPACAEMAEGMGFFTPKDES